VHVTLFEVGVEALATTGIHKDACFFFSSQFFAQGHLLSVASLAVHPTKPIVVTASDDKTWKMWHMPAGDLIMCGEGHKVVRTCAM
jgi:hypothetical protein